MNSGLFYYIQLEATPYRKTVTPSKQQESPESIQRESFSGFFYFNFDVIDLIFYTYRAFSNFYPGAIHRKFL
jgi:hypothetical protein